MRFPGVPVLGVRARLTVAAMAMLAIGLGLFWVSSTDRGQRVVISNRFEMTEVAASEVRATLVVELGKLEDSPAAYLNEADETAGHLHRFEGVRRITFSFFDADGGSSTPADYAARSQGASTERLARSTCRLRSYYPVCETERNGSVSDAEVERLEGLAGDFVLAGDNDEEVLTVADLVEHDGEVAAVVATRSVPKLNEFVGSTSSIISLRQFLAIAFGLVLLTWLALGRVLRPVDAITRHVEQITINNLHERVRLPKAHDEVRRLAETMNDMLDRLEDTTGLHRQFVADASHELRSPIAVASGALELHAKHPDRIGSDELVRILTEETSRLSRLVDDLLILARLDERLLPDRLEPIDLDELCLAEAARWPEGKVRVQVITPARVMGNANVMTRAIRNVVDNAVRYADSQVEVEVTVEGEVPDQLAIVRVVDDGPGIPASSQEEVFERFSRLDASRNRADGGVGLGLAIVREVVEGHGGSVVASTTEGGGATFTISAPLAEAHLADAG